MLKSLLDTHLKDTPAYIAARRMIRLFNPSPDPLSQPILIYQMGKVGSTTIELALRSHSRRLHVRHLHMLSDLDAIEAKVRSNLKDPRDTLGEIEKGRNLLEEIRRHPEWRINIVSLVRDPVSRNISAFFQGLSDRFPNYRVDWDAGRLTLRELADSFLADEITHDAPLQWFDRQLKPVFGHDVFATPFDHQKKREIQVLPKTRLLVLRLEDLDHCMADAFQEFLGIRLEKPRSANIGDEKGYADIYRAFKSSLVLPPDYLDRMYTSKLVKHFYTPDEISRFRQTWERS